MDGLRRRLTRSFHRIGVRTERQESAVARELPHGLALDGAELEEEDQDAEDEPKGQPHGHVHHGSDEEGGGHDSAVHGVEPQRLE